MSCLGHLELHFSDRLTNVSPFVFTAELRGLQGQLAGGCEVLCCASHRIRTSPCSPNDTSYPITKLSSFSLPGDSAWGRGRSAQVPCLQLSRCLPPPRAAALPVLWTFEQIPTLFSRSIASFKQLVSTGLVCQRLDTVFLRLFANLRFSAKQRTGHVRC